MWPSLLIGKELLIHWKNGGKLPHIHSKIRAILLLCSCNYFNLVESTVQIDSNKQVSYVLSGSINSRNIVSYCFKNLIGSFFFLYFQLEGVVLFFTPCQQIFNGLRLIILSWMDYNFLYFFKKKRPNNVWWAMRITYFISYPSSWL